MPVVREAFPWLIILPLLSILLWRRLVVKQASSPKAEKKNKRPWSLRPKTPKDCPGCAAQVQLRQVNPTPAEPPPPWEMVKGPGGPMASPPCRRLMAASAACRLASRPALTGTSRIVHMFCLYTIEQKY